MRRLALEMLLLRETKLWWKWSKSMMVLTGRSSTDSTVRAFISGTLSCFTTSLRNRSYLDSRESFFKWMKLALHWPCAKI